ncbi:SulP family inorganic anion transporter [Arhodomonas sp. KWT2]|uniref:SulP family inorganic anion transporter n=2 Tax=unclassified Arhodomonas TaxID=2621637 RepID=UPI0035C11549
MKLQPPLLTSLRGYDRQAFSDDLTAGIITAILLVPQGMAYALLAGLPAETGLYASIIPPAVYAVFGTSRTLAVGPVAVAALMVADALSRFAGADPQQWITGASILAAEVGVILAVGGALRLGRLVNLIGHPVLSGFTSAAAALIMLSQVGHLLGVDAPRGDAVTMITGLYTHIGAVSAATTVTSVLAIAALVLARRPLQRLLTGLGASPNAAALASRTAPLAVVIAASLAMAALAGNGGAPVRVVGDIPAGLPAPGLDFLASAGWVELAPSAVLIALIGYVESVTVAKVLGGRRRERVDANQELLALGAANFGSALVGTMPAAGGFSRSVVNFDAGARTQVAALITAGLVGVVAAFFTGWFAFLPKAVLAAIIVVAIWQLIDFRGAIETTRYDRGDGATLIATVAGVLGFGLEPGLVAGIALSLFLYVWRSSRPHMAVIGRIPGTEHFRNVERHEVVCDPRRVLLRIDENIYFANAEPVRDFVLAALDRHPDAEAAVLVMSSVSYIDSSGLEMLEALHADLQAQSVALHLAEVKGPVADRLAQTHLWHGLPESHHHLSVAAAVDALGGDGGNETTAAATRRRIHGPDRPAG